MSDIHQWGATPEEWDTFVLLGLTSQLLPCVSKLDAPISPYSRMKELGKTPSLYNAEGQAVGITGWPSRTATDRQVQEWKKTPDYGICLQTRLVKAFDIDLPDRQQAGAVVESIQSTLTELGLRHPLPLRWRTNSGKCLLLFANNSPLTKRVLPVGADRIELLGVGSQFIAAGTHPSGVRYQWNDLPTSLEHIHLTDEQVEAVWSMLDLSYATGEGQGGGALVTPADTADSGAPDPVSVWLEAQGLSRGRGSGNQLYVSCPWVSAHGKVGDLTQTVWLVGGTGGYETGHFQCLDAACTGRTKGEFLNAVGFSVDGFDVIPEPVSMVGQTLTAFGVDVDDLVGAPPAGARRREPLLERVEAQSVASQANLCIASSGNLDEILQFQHITGLIFRYNRFTDRIDVTPLAQPAQTHGLEEIDILNLRSRLHRHPTHPFKEIDSSNLSKAIKVCASKCSYDPVIDWLMGLKWDGIPRVDSFYEVYLGCKPSPEAVAYGRYLWTAMAGRALVPGVKADIMPIWISEQGTQKSVSVEALVPHLSMFGELNLEHYDHPDTPRKLRGKLVLEVNELRGLQTRAAEDIKAFITSRFEESRKLYTEDTRQQLRRCIFVGTTNEKFFLSDPTGNRRYAPLEVGRQDVEAVKHDRDQLWAEAVSIFEQFGIQYREAEVLAQANNERHLIVDDWEGIIRGWVTSFYPNGDHKKEVLTNALILSEALNLREATHLSSANSKRVSKIMTKLGYRKGFPRNSSGDNHRGWIV